MGAAAYARRSRQSQPRGWKKTSDESRPPVPRMSVEKWVDVASWLGDVWPVASEEAAKQPENLGSIVFSIARDAARAPHTKSSGSSGSVSGSGEAKGGKRGYCRAKGTKRGGREGEACPREACARGSRVAGVGVGGEYRRCRGTCPKGPGGGKRRIGRWSLRRDRWRGHRAKEPPAIRTQRRKIATWILQRSRSSMSRMPEWGTSESVGAAGG